MKNMFLRRGITVFVLVPIVLALVAVAALAATQTTSGSLNRDGTLVQYTTKRYSTLGGNITEDLNSGTVNIVRLGLRNTSGNQFTNTEQWDHGDFSTKTFWNRNNSSYNFPVNTPFYMNGRMNACYWWEDNTWSGILTY